MVKCFIKVFGYQKMWVKIREDNGDVIAVENRKDASIFYSPEKCNAIMETTPFGKIEGSVEVTDEERFAS